MSTIKNIRAREILDSRGNPTIEVIVSTREHSAKASVPSGASTGVHEALELRDGTKRFHGFGVQKAIRNVEKKIFPVLKGKDPANQREIDRIMIELDGTPNKSKLGANAILGVSLACARLSALHKRKPLYKYLNSFVRRKISIPTPHFNVINGGKHADNNLSVQEFMIVPQFKSMKKNVRVASEVYHTLKRDLHRKYGRGVTNIGDEGGFAPQIFTNVKQALNILVKSIKDAGYAHKVKIAIDCGASEFYKKKYYLIDEKKLNTKKLLQYYLSLLRKYPIILIEDPFEQEDFASFREFKEKSKIKIVADDLTTTNASRIKTAIQEKSCNCLLLKVNQIGTLTESIEAATLAFKAGWDVMVSHRSGETTDTFVADLAVGLGAQMIKAGAPARGERVAKYNRLMEIEEELHSK